MDDLLAEPLPSDAEILDYLLVHVAALLRLPDCGGGEVCLLLDRTPRSR